MTIITQEKINTHRNAYNNKTLYILKQFWNPTILSLINKLVYIYSMIENVQWWYRRVSIWI
jgi:hypothetical protein